MSNNYNLAVDLTAITADIATVDAVVDEIRATDIVNVRIDASAIQDVVDNIRAVDVPAVQADINEGTVEIEKAMGYMGIIESDNLLQSNDAEVTIGDNSYQKVKEITCPFTGTYRIKFDLRTTNTIRSACGQIYKTGAGFGTERLTRSETYVNYSEDLAFTKDDLIQLYIYTYAGTHEAKARNLRLYGDVEVGFVNNM